MQYQTAIRTGMNSDSQAFPDNLMASGTFLCGVSGVHGNDSPTGTLSLVDKYFYELVPRNIRDGFGQISVPDHPPNIKIFDRDEAVLLDYVVSGLVKEVKPLVGNLFMKSGKLDSGLVPVFTAFLLTGEPSLKSGQSLLGIDKELMVLNFRSVRKHGKVLKVDVNADFLFSFRMLSLLVVNLATERDKPLPRRSVTNSHGLDFSFGHTMKNERDVSKPIHSQHSLANDFETTLRKGYASVELFESGIPDLDIFSLFLFLDPAEEVGKGFVNPVVEILENLGVNRNSIDTKILYAFIKVKFGKVFAGCLIGGNLDLEKFVIGKSASFKLLRKTNGLSPCRIQPELVASHTINMGEKVYKTTIHPTSKECGLSCGKRW